MPMLISFMLISFMRCMQYACSCAAANFEKRNNRWMTNCENHIGKCKFVLTLRSFYNYLVNLNKY